MLVWCPFLDTKIDGSNRVSMGMLNPLARRLIPISSVKSSVK